MLLTRGEEIRFEAGDLFPENILLFSCVLARGLHAIDRANEFWEIEVLHGLVESLGAHKKSASRYMHSVKHAGILDFGNGYLPHRLGPSRARSLASGLTAYDDLTPLDCLRPNLSQKEQRDRVCGS